MPLTDRERLENIQVSTIDTQDAVILAREDFTWLCERAMARAPGVPTSELAVEPVQAEEESSEPGTVMGCCADNLEHRIVRLIPPPGAARNVVGDGEICVKSNKTGEYVPVYCCPLCRKQG